MSAAGGEPGRAGSPPCHHHPASCSPLGHRPAFPDVSPPCLALLQVIHEGADPVEVVTQNMSRPLKPEVNPLVAEAAHHSEVPPRETPTSKPGCVIGC